MALGFKDLAIRKFELVALLPYKKRTKGLLLVICLIKSKHKAFCSFSALLKASKMPFARFLPYKKRAKGLLLVFYLIKSEQNAFCSFSAL